MRNQAGPEGGVASFFLSPRPYAIVDRDEVRIAYDDGVVAVSYAADGLAVNVGATAAGGVVGGQGFGEGA